MGDSGEAGYSARVESADNLDAVKSDFEKTYPFSEAEWESCLKVLDALKDEPFNNPDNDRFKSLVQKIAKRARKSARKASYTAKRSDDLAVQKNSVIVANALDGKTFYSADEESLRTEPHFTRLNVPKNCYCCNQSFDLSHFFYNRICPDCATLNYQKRHYDQTLSGKTALLTGCRVKVGYATALKLLRNGARVIGTTRFPALALQQFRQESDYSEWKHRLLVYGLDLRDLRQLEAFMEYVKQETSVLDILINNAAQTIKYSDDYYVPLMNQEQKLLQHDHCQLIPNPTSVGQSVDQILPEVPLDELPVLSRFGQPVDLRDKNSWNSRLSDIDLVELLEVNLINQISPFMLVKGLKPLMKRNNEHYAFIVNVTSSEGLFSYINKTPCHPHTNMTKASLNMMTRTSAQEFAEDNILMNSVDVGWISTGARENLRKEQFENAYVPPLDPVDGACRILDPIYKGLNGERLIGKMLKDYQEHLW